jgi:hypothetical protein
MRPENAARTLAMIGAFLLILVAFLRLLSVYLLISDPRLQSGPTEKPGPSPALGLYAFSGDGRQVRFERGVFIDGMWQGGVFTLNLQDGSITPGDLRTEPTLYVIEDGQIRLNSENAAPRLALSPAGLQLTDQAYSPDGEALAFVDARSNNNRQLYAIRGLSPAEPIMRANDIHGMAWSPDKERLVFVASVDESEEIFIYSFADRQTTRLTADGQDKSSPIFSPDGRQVAFLAAPPAPDNANTSRQIPSSRQFQPTNRLAASGVDVYLIDTDGENLHRLTDTQQDETGLAWTADGDLAFSAWQPHWPAVAYLYAISPGSAAVRRLYPPVAITEFSCQPALPGGNQVDVQIVISNDSQQAVTIPLEVSADRQPLDLITSRSQFRVQREDLALQPGEVRTLAWTVNVPEDIRIYLSASIESGVEFPISVSFCEVTPRRLYLPRLPLLRATLLVGLLGSLLCVPWLRHTHRVGFWVLAATFWILLLALMLVESLIMLNA